jgi:hypothetical protein
MMNFGVNAMAVIAGIIGGGIGFLVLVLAGLIVALPYVILTNGYLQSRGRGRRVASGPVV